MTFTFGTVQSHCKNEHNQINWNEITQDMRKSDSILLLASNHVMYLKFRSKQ